MRESDKFPSRPLVRPRPACADPNFLLNIHTLESCVSHPLLRKSSIPPKDQTFCIEVVMLDRFLTAGGPKTWASIKP
jgi:hypothetical protein